MAEMQTSIVGKTKDLRDCGCVDQRIEVLGAHIDEVISYLVEAMEHQTSTKVPRLPEPRLLELGQILRAACSAMRELDIPDSLLHNDLNAGNVLFDGSKCTFIDWSEAYVGNPFLVFQQLCALMSRNEDTSLPWVQHLRSLYKEPWRRFLSDAQMDRAFALTPLLAVFSRLYGRGSWPASSEVNDSHLHGFARSLARYMDRAAQNADLIEAL
jgi:Ser/Thr protein kinase RdoA (MazF antagonist)